MLASDFVGKKVSLNPSCCGFAGTGLNGAVVLLGLTSRGMNITLLRGGLGPSAGVASKSTAPTRGPVLPYYLLDIGFHVAEPTRLPYPIDHGLVFLWDFLLPIVSAFVPPLHMLVHT